jgi:translocation and assembly module TamB
VPQLRGRLRGRALDGRGNFVLRGSDVSGDLALSLGNSRLDARGRIGDTLDVDARFAPVHLDDLWPDAAGSLRGSLKLTGARNAPNIDADLDGSGLRWGDYRAQSLQARGRLPWRGGNGALDIDAQGLDVGLAFDSLRIDARGAVENLQLDADARSELGTLAFAGNAAKRGNTWQGALASLQVAPVKGAQWRLQQAARFSWTASAGPGRNGALSNACLASSRWRHAVRECRLAAPRPRLQWHRPAADAAHALSAGARRWPAVVAARRARGQRTSPPTRQQLARHCTRHLKRWRPEEQRTRAPRAGVVCRTDARCDIRSATDRSALTSVLNEDGRIDARVATGWDAYAPLSGEVALDTDELTWMELFSPDIVEPTGRLDGRIALGGTRAQPSLGGQAHLSGLHHRTAGAGDHPARRRRAHDRAARRHVAHQRQPAFRRRHAQPRRYARLARRGHTSGIARALAATCWPRTRATCAR